MIDHGQIIEQGSYDKLISMNGEFARFVNNSFTNTKEEAEEEVVKSGSIIKHKASTLIKT
jgi:hypothetical protein